jgi:NADPH-dependent glutamate synthase beta chain and related oxidoreductases
MAEKKRDTNIELNLTDMFWQFACKWKKVLILAIVMGLIVGGIKLVTSLINIHDPEYLEEVEKKNKLSQESYEFQVASYEKQIENMQSQIERKEDLRDNSVILRMDPYNTFIKNVTFYVSTDYKIMPGMDYQNPNYTNALTNGYMNAIATMNIDKAVATPEEPNLIGQNPYPNNAYTLLEVSEMSGNGLIYVTMRGDSQDCVDHILAAVKNMIEERRELLTKTIGEHEISIISEVDEVVTDTTVRMLQTNFVTSNSELAENLKLIQSELEDLKQPSMIGTSAKSVVFGFIKFGILGGIIGVVLGFLIWGLFACLRGRVNSVEELRQKYDAVMLAAIPKESVKRSKLDKKLVHHLGIRKRLNYRSGLDLAAANIRLYLKDAPDLLLIGTVEERILNKLCKDLSEKLPDKKIIVGGDVNVDAAAVSAVEEGHTVVCVEELNESSYRFINHELEAIENAREQETYFIVVG